MPPSGCSMGALSGRAHLRGLGLNNKQCLHSGLPAAFNPAVWPPGLASFAEQQQAKHGQQCHPHHDSHCDAGFRPGRQTLGPCGRKDSCSARCMVGWGACAACCLCLASPWVAGRIRLHIPRWQCGLHRAASQEKHGTVSERAPSMHKFAPNTDNAGGITTGTLSTARLYCCALGYMQEHVGGVPLTHRRKGAGTTTCKHPKHQLYRYQTERQGHGGHSANDRVLVPKGTQHHTIRQAPVLWTCQHALACAHLSAL
jgi:hypothetical protein